MAYDATDRAQRLTPRAAIAALLFVAAVAARGHANAQPQETQPTPTPSASLAAPFEQPTAASPTPIPLPTSTPFTVTAPGVGQTPIPAYSTPTPSSGEFPRENRGPTPLPTTTPTLPPGPNATPTPAPLPSGIARVTADQLYGNNGPGGGFTAYGHVRMEYADAVVVADQAVYSATTKILRATGNVRLTEANGDTATASALEYHSDSDRAEMFDVEGSTAAIYFGGEQIQGRLYYKGKEAILDPGGHTIIRNGWITTCEPNHVAYHVTGKEIEIKPHDHLIAHGSALYLGSVLVAALGVLALPLVETAERRPTAFAPRIGYNSVYGVFIRNYINFYRGPTWYGTYHVDFYQKVGIGIGADLFFQRQDGRGGGQFSIYEINNNAQQQELSGTRNTVQASLNLSRLFTDHLVGNLSFNYSGQSAIFTALPTTTNTNFSLTHSGQRSSTSYLINNTQSGPSHSFGGSVQHTIAFSSVFTQTVGLNLQDNTNPGSFSRAVGFNWDTHVSGRALDADLVIQTNHGSQTNNINIPGVPETTTPVIGIQRVPELRLIGRPFEVANLRLPIALTLIDGVYNDGYDQVSTSRLDFNAQVGPGILRFGDSTLINASATVHQDAYGTGDLLGYIGYQATMQNFFGHHADNTLVYTAQSVRGFTPMRSFDSQSGFDQISEVLNVYTMPYYHFTASTNYDFTHKFIGTINYQLAITPNPYAFINLGTSYDPHGSGYSPLVVSLATPLSRADYLQFTGDYDFHQHSLQGQNYYLTHTVSDCYVVRVAYHQPLKEVDVSVALLAFPGQSATFGINNNGPIIAQPGGF